MAVLAHDVYTNQPNAGPYVIFPTHAHQILSNFVHILGVTVLSYLFARRTENDRFTCWKWWCSLTWARLLIILIFLDSWVFLAFSGILVNGVGLSYSVPVCSLGIFGCILFYAGSKGLTYLFLVERVWVVYSAGKPVARRHSRIYRGCAIIAFGYSAIIILMIVGRYADIRDDGVCVIGLHSFATIPLLAYDLLINIFLTSMFLWFLCREQKITDRLRHLARRTAFAACVALTISCVNILILALLEGKQLGWVCLASCGADVTVNAIALFWVTGTTKERQHWYGALDHKDITELPSLNFPVSFVAPDPEMGLSRTRTVDTVSGVQNQNQIGSKGMNTRLADLDESVHEKEFCEGSSKDGHQGYGYEQCDDGDGKQDRRGDSGSDKSIAIENIECDITNSFTSGGTEYHTVTEPDKGSAVQSWRLALDFDLQRSPNGHPDHSEPDSPATHETEGSRARLTPGSSHPQASRAQKRQNDPKKQRRKRWHARSRQGYFRPHSRPASSPPAASPHVDPANVAFNVEPPALPAPPAPCKVLDPPSLPSILQRARQMQRTILRSHSDSLVRVSDPALFPARPRHSQ